MVAAEKIRNSLYRTGLKSLLLNCFKTVFQTHTIKKHWDEAAKNRRERERESNRVNNLTQQTRLIQSRSKQLKIRSNFFFSPSKDFSQCATANEKKSCALQDLSNSTAYLRNIFFLSHSFAFFFVLKKTFAEQQQQQQPGHKSTGESKRGGLEKHF